MTDFFFKGHRGKVCFCIDDKSSKRGHSARSGGHFCIAARRRQCGPSEGSFITPAIGRSGRSRHAAAPSLRSGELGQGWQRRCHSPGRSLALAPWKEMSWEGTRGAEDFPRACVGEVPAGYLRIPSIRMESSGLFIYLPPASSSPSLITSICFSRALKPHLPFHGQST